MVKAQSPEHYQTAVRQQIKRAEKKKGRLFSPTTLKVVSIALAFGLLTPLLLGVWLGLTGINLVPDEQLNNVSAVMALVGWGFSTWLFRNQPETEQSFLCPHCDNLFSLNEDYVCANCADEIKSSTTFSDRYIFQECPSCKEKPVAIICPACGNDIVLDIAAYEAAPPQGFGKAKTNRFTSK